MEKLQSQTTKDYLIRVMSLNMDIPVKTIEAVVSHQFEEAHKALATSSSIEISGFCRFIFNVKKLKKEYEKQLSKIEVFSRKLEDPNLTDQKKASWELKRANCYKWIEGIKPKLERYGIIQDIGGVEKSHITSGEIEGVDRVNIPGEVESL